MLQFEALLLKQLQRQQSRAEFCDTVLQSQGVLVPVHSCVLSAFSPWLCGALSSMPAPVAGKRRLIELQSVEACTLLSLVSLLYSGQINGNRKDILSAAELLGIRLPEEHAEETHGEKERRRKEHAGAEQLKESNPQGVGLHEKSLEMTVGEKIRESGTQTERERETDERETQTDYVCSDHQQNFHVISHAACSSTSHEQGTYTNAPDATVMLQGVQVPPERTSTCDALPVASETQVCQIGGPPCLSSSRSHPHECSLPLSPCSSSFCQNSVGTPDPSLLHTVSLPPVPQTSTQSMDLLLDDIMLGLNFLPPVHTENQTQQNRFVKTMIPSIPSVTKKACPSMHSSVKPLDLSRQQPEGELCDILEHFLNTFEQHVAGCDLGVAEETPHNQSNHYTPGRGLDEAQVNRDPGTESWSNTTFKPLPPLNSHPHANVSSHCVRGPNTFTTSTEPPPISSSAADTSADQNQLRLSTALRQLNPSSRAGFKGKFESKEKEPQTQRVTRSQSRKRKLEATLSSLQTPSSPVKKKYRRKQSSRLAGKERPQVRSLCRQRKHCIADICVSKVSNAGANKSNRTQTRTTKDAKRATTRSLSRKRCLETNIEEKTCRANTEGSELETEHASASSRTSQLPAKKTIGGAYIEVASSAFEKMRMLLENQRKREEDRSRTEKQSIHIENVRVGIPRVEEDASGVKEGLAAENTSHSHLEKSGEERADGRAVEAEDNDRTESAENAVLEEKSETVELGCRQENGKVAATEMEQMMTSEPSTSFQTDLLPDTEPVKSSLVAEESDHNNNEPLLRTAEITQSTFCSSSSHTVSSDVLQLPCSHQDLTSSAKGTEMADLTLESGEMTPVKPAEGKLKFLLSSLPHHKLLLSHSPEKAVSGGGSEEEEVDVLEVSSPASEIVIMPTDIWGAELSTEEEDVEEDMDVDVVGVELD